MKTGTLAQTERLSRTSLHPSEQEFCDCCSTRTCGTRRRAVMRLSLRVCAVLLGILWMPWTVHCALERVGLLEQSALSETHPEACSEQEGRCGHDTCDLVESGLYRTFLSSLIVPPPAEPVEPWSGELAPETLPVSMAGRKHQRSAQLVAELGLEPAYCGAGTVAGLPGLGAIADRRSLARLVSEGVTGKPVSR